MLWTVMSSVELSVISNCLNSRCDRKILWKYLFCKWWHFHWQFLINANIFGMQIMLNSAVLTNIDHKFDFCNYLIIVDPSLCLWVDISIVYIKTSEFKRIKEGNIKLLLVNYFFCISLSLASNLLFAQICKCFTIFAKLCIICATSNVPFT